MNLKEIKEMIQLMNENNLNEIELERDGLKVRLVRGQKAVSAPLQQTSVEDSVIKSESGDAEKFVPETKEVYEQIKSPMVGTFYRSASSDASPFTEVENIVKPGDVLCIIEAMKLMNEIKAEIKGKIKEVLVDNGEPVEYGQPLFLIEPI